MAQSRAYRAGESLEDYCRACRTDRMHVVVAADAAGAPLRVTCGYCRSEHNYRGGPRVGAAPPGAPPYLGRGPRRPGASEASQPPAVRPSAPAAATPARAPWPLVSDRERTGTSIMVPGSEHDLETLLRRVIREETGITAVAPAEKWRGGSLVLRPGTPGLQDKSWPIETFFHKIVMLRNRLRMLEQQVNGSDLPEDQKVKLQGYVSGCYGTLTSFNVLFADEDDQFKGSGG
jgi:hypothetical protein